MLQKYFCIACFLFASNGMFSQENVFLTESKKAPLSIYTEGIYYDAFNPNLNLSLTSLSFKDLKFLRVDENDIANNLFTIDFRNFGRKATIFSYESYNKTDLYKHFQRIPDFYDVIRLNDSQSEN